MGSTAVLICLECFTDRRIVSNIATLKLARQKVPVLYRHAGAVWGIR